MPTSAESMARSFSLQAGEDRTGRPTHFGGDLNMVKVSGRDTNDTFLLMEYRGRSPGGPPLHLHPDQDEIFFVQEGHYQFVCGKQEVLLGPGETIFLPRTIPHTFCQLSESGLLLFMFTPAGKMEEFFEEASKLQGPPDPEQMNALFAAHGMKVVGPPLPIG